MTNRPVIIAATVALLALMWPQWAAAENSKQFGEYVVHYNAFTSDTLAPDIARRYGFVRSKNRGLLNITVLKSGSGATGVPVTAQVRATATNLTGQLKTLSVREVREREAIYYIGEFRVADAETLRFNVEVQPDGDRQWHRVVFSQQFFTR